MIDGVPSGEELIKMGLAKRIQRGGATMVQVSPEGHRLLGEKLKEAAERNGKLSGDELRKVLSQRTPDQTKKRKK